MMVLLVPWLRTLLLGSAQTTSVVRALLDAGWEVGRHVGSGSRRVWPLGGTWILQEATPAGLWV
jgi:hypothetical protein